MSILGNRIKKEREGIGLTREELANKIGVSYSAVSMYEQGNREPNNSLIIEMCKLFNCTIDYLIGNSVYRNYEDFQEAQKFALENISMLNKEEVQQIALTLNYINQNKIENADEFIYNKISNFNSNNKETLIKIITLLHHKNHDKNLPEKQDVFVLDKYSSLDDWKEAEDLINNNKPNESYNTFYMCPVYGQISAGQPNWAEECIEGRLPLDPELMGIVNPEEHFFLRVNRRIDE